MTLYLADLTTNKINRSSQLLPDKGVNHIARPELIALATQSRSQSLFCFNNYYNEDGVINRQVEATIHYNHSCMQNLNQ